MEFLEMRRKDALRSKNLMEYKKLRWISSLFFQILEPWEEGNHNLQTNMKMVGIN